MNIKDARQPAPRIVVWVRPDDLEDLLSMIDVRADKWASVTHDSIRQLLANPPSAGTIHYADPMDDGNEPGFLERYNDHEQEQRFGILINCIANKGYRDLVPNFPITEVFYTAIGERTLDSDYSIWWLSEKECQQAQGHADREQFRHEALIQFLDNAFLLKGPPVHGVNIADGLGHVVRALNIAPPDANRPTGILMFSEGTPYLPTYGLVQQLSIMDMSEHAKFTGRPRTPIETHTQFMDALNKEAEEVIQSADASEMSVDSAVRGFQKRTVSLLAYGRHDTSALGLIPIGTRSNDTLLLPGERSNGYQGQLVDPADWRLQPRLRYPSNTKPYHLTHDQFNAARELRLKRYVGDVTTAARSLAEGVPRFIAVFDALYELAEEALSNQIYVVTENLGSHPMWMLAFMSDDWDRVSAFMTFVKEQGHLIKVYDNETQTVISRPPKEESDDGL